VGFSFKRGEIRLIFYLTASLIVLGCLHMIIKLHISQGNSKLIDDTLIFSLPSGFTCPGAKDCLSKADRKTGKITDGKNQKFRCFSASQEAVYPSLRKAVWNNFTLLKKVSKDLSKPPYLSMRNLLVAGIKKKINHKINKLRIHVGGDFYSEDYFKAWLLAAKTFPSLIFYAYTKSIPFIVSNLNDIPSNVKFVCSEGGKFDHLIEEYGLKRAKVVFSLDEAKELGLDLDHDDSHAYDDSAEDFGLLIHGTQKINSSASKAWKKIKKTVGGYSKKRKYGK